jgi:hypothetical protein
VPVIILVNMFPLKLERKSRKAAELAQPAEYDKETTEK